MSVNVQNLLCIDLFKSANVVAGMGGINKLIKRINFVDCPLPEDIMNLGLIKTGDLFVNSFYDVKDDEEKLYDLIKVFINCCCAGSFVITEYIKKLPPKVIKLCDENNFPVVFIDPNIPYAEIIKTTMEMILSDQSDKISEMSIEKLLENNISKKAIIDTANDLNKFTKKYYSSAYVKINEISNSKRQLLVSNIKNISIIEATNFKNGIILVINFDKNTALNTIVNQIENLLKRSYDDFHIGVSDTFEKIDEFNICIKQSLLAFDISNVIHKNTVHYKDINLYKILYPLKDSSIIQDFYDEIIKPLISCDGSDDKFDLVNTIEVYLENDGDYKKTAAILNQHENTVRYRIQKAKRILNLENNNFKFIEQISVALKIKNILLLLNDYVPTT